MVIGIVVVAGSLCGALASRLNLPRITGYIVAGMLLSPSVLNVISGTRIASLSFIVTGGLSIIGYQIGGSLYLGMVRQEWKKILWITLLQGLCGWVFTLLFVVLVMPAVSPLPGGTVQHVYFPMALVLGAIAWATAPAVTIAIIRECGVRGSVPATILSVVALTDVLAVVFYFVSAGVAAPLMKGNGSFSLYQTLIFPFVDLFEAVAAGAIAGACLVGVARLVKAGTFLLVAVVGWIAFYTGAVEYFGLSSVLVSMVAGFTAANFGGREGLFSVVENVEDLLFTVFFVVSALRFDVNVMMAAGALTFIVEASRCGGKWLGTFAGGVVSGASPFEKRYLGLALLPKAGLTIGLAYSARAAFPVMGDIMFNALLASTFINMLFTPPLAKFTVSKLGQARAESLCTP